MLMPQTLHEFYLLDAIISLFDVVDVEYFEQFQRYVLARAHVQCLEDE